MGIDFSVNLNIPMEMPFRGADICLILGNLLENAVEAAQKAEGKKYIRFHMKYDKNNLLLFVENNYKGVLIKTKDKRLKSTKTDAGNHGVGLSSVYRIAAKYHGVVTIDDDVANRFLIRVLFILRRNRKSYINTRFFYKKDKFVFFCSSVEETTERRFKL